MTYFRLSGVPGLWYPLSTSEKLPLDVDTPAMTDLDWSVAAAGPVFRVSQVGVQKTKGPSTNTMRILDFYMSHGFYLGLVSVLICLLGGSL